MKNIEESQDRVLTLLSNSAADFYLAGGTALSRYYFHHRESYDLDFFTRNYDSNRILELIEIITRGENASVRLLNTLQEQGLAKFAMYLLVFAGGIELKIDFVEDHLEILKPFNVINGINVLSIEDIYLRKLFAVSGTISQKDETGRTISLGGRQEAKDFFDLYFLSTTFSPVSVFAREYGNNQIKEGLIRWLRQYDRMTIKSGLLDIKTKTGIDYKAAEKHFENEIGKILEEEIGEI